MKLVSIVVLLGLCLAGCVAQSPATEQGQPVLRGTVLEVKDGDSLVVQLDSGPIEVRLHGIDAPEYDQPVGREAQAALRKRLPRGTDVLLEPFEQDRYSRLVASVFVGAENIDQWLVGEGLAWAYRRYISEAELCELEDHARRAQRGVWALPTTQWIAPWDWRARKRDATHEAADYSGETLERCVAALRSERPLVAKASPGVASSTRGDAFAPPGECRIKGNIGAGGRRIYHVPGSASYDATRIDPAKGERWFCTVEEAELAGWRK